MAPYLLILLAIVSRIAPHPGWFNFTAVGGSLLFFGARRPLRQVIIPVALLAATDYYLTTRVYNFPFHLQEYLLTWAWYAAVPLLGWLLLKGRASAGRIAGAAALAATSFFAVSNFAVWAGSALYAHTLAGLGACYVAALPFYRNDLISTTLVAGLAFGTPEVARYLVQARQGHRQAAV